jgi:hypothetical protein
MSGSDDADIGRRLMGMLAQPSRLCGAQAHLAERHAEGEAVDGLVLVAAGPMGALSPA